MKMLSVIAVVYVLLPFTSMSQSIVVRDIKGKVVNNDTLQPVAQFTQKPPYTELDCYLFAENTGSKTMKMRTKKTELIIHPKAEHGICFANQCYQTNIFISPNTDTVLPGGIDSTFSGHYRYLDYMQPASSDLVFYTFYDDNNPADSTVVYVRYKTKSATGIAATPSTSVTISPNPASNAIQFQYTAQQAGASLAVYNSIGQIITTVAFSAQGTIILNTSNWVPGMYYYAINGKGLLVSKGSFAVAH